MLRFCQLKFYYRIIFFSLDIKAIRKQHLMPFERKKKALYGVFFLSFFFIAKCRLNVFNYIQVIRSNVSVDKELFDT